MEFHPGFAYPRATTLSSLFLLSFRWSGLPDSPPHSGLIDRGTVPPIPLADGSFNGPTQVSLLLVDKGRVFVPLPSTRWLLWWFHVLMFCHGGRFMPPIFVVMDDLFFIGVVWGYPGSSIPPCLSGVGLFIPPPCLRDSFIFLFLPLSEIPGP